MPELTEAEVTRVAGKCEGWCGEVDTVWGTVDCLITLRLIADWKRLRAENEEQGKILDVTPGMEALGLIFEDMAEAGIDPNVIEKLAAERDSLRSLAGELVGALKVIRGLLKRWSDKRPGSLWAETAIETIAAALARAAEMGVGK